MKINMRNIIVVLILTSTNAAIAQQSAQLPDGYVKNLSHDLQIGMVVCEDANGEMNPCSGALEESVIGIVTNVPYVTVNKPVDPKASRFNFVANVSEADGAISQGDYLKIAAGGTLVRIKTDEIPFAYAVALENANGKGQITVKVIR